MSFTLKFAYLRAPTFPGRKFRRVLKILAASVLFGFAVLLTLVSLERKCPPDGCRKSGEFIHRFPTRHHRPNSDVKRILRWTGFFEDTSWESTDDSYFAACKERRCTLTNDRNLLYQSDAVLFHVGALWNFWRGVSLPSRRYPYQTWILHNVEPPPRNPLDMSKFSGVFNWTAFYRRDSDVPVAYGGFTEYPRPPTLKVSKLAGPNWFLENNRFSAWMSSNCHDYNRRQVLVKRLKKLLGDDMDLYGSCGDKRCPETICYDTISNYKFFFTFENSNCRDYISEKFWAALQRRQVPVVMGGASAQDYHKIAPPHSFIHVDNFGSTEALVNHLREVGRNETAYNEYLAWSLQADIYSELPARRKWLCDLCAALHDRSRPAQVYDDVQGWVEDDICPMWSLSNQIWRFIDSLRIKLGLL
ncbi:hypothetical protein RRG08_001418 [Elysia crispata]|uniref:Fucosyltransferase n=1 Tax=Elysia crispata TaxID=231223 RepID=A0AAE0ZQZ3_9GAST|nr:hypothetical protein RRG08_001418 [Elysia crispata]